MKAVVECQDYILGTLFNSFVGVIGATAAIFWGGVQAREWIKKQPWYSNPLGASDALPFLYACIWGPVSLVIAFSLIWGFAYPQVHLTDYTILPTLLLFLTGAIVVGWGFYIKLIVDIFRGEEDFLVAPRRLDQSIYMLPIVALSIGWSWLVHRFPAITDYPDERVHTRWVTDVANAAIIRPTYHLVWNIVCFVGTVPGVILIIVMSVLSVVLWQPERQNIGMSLTNSAFSGVLAAVMIAILTAVLIAGAFALFVVAFIAAFYWLLTVVIAFTILRWLLSD